MAFGASTDRGRLMLRTAVLATAAFVALAASSCGTEATHTTGSSAATPSKSGAGKAGSGIGGDCHPDGVASRLREMRKLGYSVAAVNVKSLDPPVSFGSPADLYTPVNVTVIATLNQAATPLPATLYVPGGETDTYLTSATGPDGVAPGQSAVIFVAPATAETGQPDGTIMSALPFDGKFVFAAEGCWKNDLPGAVSARARTQRLVNGFADQGPDRAGFRIPLDAVRAIF